MKVNVKGTVLYQSGGEDRRCGGSMLAGGMVGGFRMREGGSDYRGLGLVLDFLLLILEQLGH